MQLYDGVHKSALVRTTQGFFNKRIHRLLELVCLLPKKKLVGFSNLSREKELHKWSMSHAKKINSFEKLPVISDNPS